MDENAGAIQRDEMVLSYHRVRMALGFMGLVLPLLLAVGGLLAHGDIQPSVSDFFHTTLRDIYVGGLCVIGVFLVSYRGYSRGSDEVFSDNIIATVGGCAAFGVAFFPNESPTMQVETVSQEALGVALSPYFHYASAFVFFFCLSMFCYVKFPRTAKPYRRRIYIWCGHMIWVAGAFILLGSYLKNHGSGDAHAFVIRHNVVFWAESFGIWIFALAWLTKGKADLTLIRVLHLPKQR